MLLVHAPSAASDPVLTPWARVVRHASVRDLEVLHQDLDAFLEEYNTSRPHQGRRCYEAMQTFIESVPLAREKVLVA